MTLEEAIEILKENDYSILNEDLKKTLGKALGIGALAASAAFGNSGIDIKQATPGNVPNDNAGFGKRTVHLQQRYNFNHDKRGVPTSYKVKDGSAVSQFTVKEEIELTKQKILATPDSMLRKYGKDSIETIAKLMVKTANKYNLDIDILLAIAGTESNFDHNATSNKGAKGMMQITKTAAFDIHTRLRGKSPETFSMNDIQSLKNNIDNAGRLLADLSGRRNNVIEMILATYNGGTEQATSWRAYTQNSKVDKYGKPVKPLTKETKDYVERCMALYNKYKEVQKNYKKS